ncbi:basic proline-rich protein-like [Mus caroli]|uniref:Basic proline-rich protein-like n=1 Tax=Mus caroli TaxID=10089 RepID=A0A6P5PUC0_MUSCR|nr:basic proline-rich protein-like [Mus caroli]
MGNRVHRSSMRRRSTHLARPLPVGSRRRPNRDANFPSRARRTDVSWRTGPEAARARRERGTQAPAGSLRKLGGGPGGRRGPPRRPRPPSPQPGLARRPSPWKPGVDSAVNMNFPSSRRPRRRRLQEPRPGSASAAAFPACPGARLLLGNPELPATLHRTADDSGEPRAAPRPPAPPGSGRAASGKPRAQARRGP